jgi:hypothetical protein
VLVVTHCAASPLEASVQAANGLKTKKDEDEALYALEKGQQYLESKPLMMFLAIAIKVY